MGNRAAFGQEKKNVNAPLVGQGGTPAIASAGAIVDAPLPNKGNIKKIKSYFFIRNVFNFFEEKKNLKL